MLGLCFLFTVPCVTLYRIIERLVPFDDSVENLSGYFNCTGGSIPECAVQRVTPWPVRLDKNSQASKIN